MSHSWCDDEAILYPPITTLVEVTHYDTEEDTWGRRFTTYLVEIQTNDISFNLPHSKVKRRFSDFVWLRKRILSESPVHKRNIAPLPRRYLFSRIDRDVVLEREKGLSVFLQNILQSETVLSDPCVHLFLQSTLSLSDIEEWLRSDKRQPSSKIILQGKALVMPEEAAITRNYHRPPSQTSDNMSLCASTASDEGISSPVSTVSGPINKAL